MKSFALLLVLALTATVGAQPDRDPDGGRVRYGDQRETFRHDGNWTELASATPTRNGTEWFNVAFGAGRFSQLRIAANGGHVIVRRVTVLFADGDKRSYRLDRRIGGRHERDVLIRLDTDKRISQIVVTPDRDVAGTYTVYGA